MSKKAASAGMGSGKDLKALYNSITQMQEKRIKIKGILQSLNMNITTFDFNEETVGFIAEDFDEAGLKKLVEYDENKKLMYSEQFGLVVLDQ